MDHTAALAEKLNRTALFAWMPPEGVEMFENCFDLEEVQLRAGEVRSLSRQLGVVLSGALERGGRLLLPGDLFGAVRDEGGRVCPATMAVHAREASEIALMDIAVLTNVCYRACWFHGRFVLEAGKHL